MKSTKLPKWAAPNSEPIWAAAINLAGLWGPKKMYLDGDTTEVEPYYQTEDGEFDVKTLGYDKTDCRITFASKSKKEVYLWVSGICAAMSLLKGWCN